MTAPQPATSGSDSVRAQIAEVLRDLSYRGRQMTGAESLAYASFLLKSEAMDSLRAEAKAEALRPFEELFSGGPDTACRTTWPDGVECCEVPLDDLRDTFARAAAYHTNPSSEEIHRGR